MKQTRQTIYFNYYQSIHGDYSPQDCTLQYDYGSRSFKIFVHLLCSSIIHYFRTMIPIYIN